MRLYRIKLFNIFEDSIKAREERQEITRQAFKEKGILGGLKTGMFMSKNDIQNYANKNPNSVLAKQYNKSPLMPGKINIPPKQSPVTQQPNNMMNGNGTTGTMSGGVTKY